MSIANSGHDENGRYTGGKAGDQTGSEWEVRSWYNRPWNCVARFDTEVGEDIAKLARNAANNDKIGYDQSQRITFWSKLKNARDYDPKNITVACEADCSAGVAAIVKAVGYRKGIAKMKNVSEKLYTGNEVSCLKAAGATILTDAKYRTSADYLRPGDILINEEHHTAINLTAGSKSATKTTVPKTSTSGNVYTVTAKNGLNYRTGAGTNYPIKGAFQHGKRLTIETVKEVNGTKWGKVKSNGRWVCMTYVESV